MLLMPMLAYIQHWTPLLDTLRPCLALLFHKRVSAHKDDEKDLNVDTEVTIEQTKQCYSDGHQIQQTTRSPVRTQGRRDPVDPTAHDQIKIHTADGATAGSARRAFLLRSLLIGCSSFGVLFGLFLPQSL